MKSLFSSADIPRPQAKEDAPRGRKTSHSGQASWMIGGGIRELKAAFTDLEPDHIYHFATMRGQWSTHELIGHLLTLTGPADVYITTWTITEAPARALVDLHQAGFIKSLSAVFDYRIKDGKPEPFQLVSGICSEMKLIKCHAKTCAIINEEWGVSLSGSANLSRNPRIERGCIDTHRATAEFDRDWILEEIHREDD